MHCMRFIVILFVAFGFSAKAALPECGSETKVVSTGKIHLPSVKPFGVSWADEIDIEFWVRRCEDKIYSDTGETSHITHKLIATITPTVPGKSKTSTYNVAVIQNNIQESISYISTDHNLYVTESYVLSRYKNKIDYSQPFTVLLSCSTHSAQYCPADHEKKFTLDPRTGTTPGAGGKISAVTGAWYDPAYNGSGFNVVQTPVGFAMYFYGYKAGKNGEALWLLSSVGPKAITKNESFTVDLSAGFVGNGGSLLGKPTANNAGLQAWGKAEVTFSSCTAGVIKLTDNKGNSVTHNVIPLVGVQGVSCSD